MKLSFKLFRCASIPQYWIASLLGLPPETPASILEGKLREENGPLAPRLKIWWSKFSFEDLKTLGIGGPETAAKATIGMEALAFDLTEQNIPCAGVCSTDPFVPQDIDRLDGALESELNRWGLSVEFKNFDWKAEYRLDAQAVGDKSEGLA